MNKVTPLKATLIKKRCASYDAESLGWETVDNWLICQNLTLTPLSLLILGLKLFGSRLTVMSRDARNLLIPLRRFWGLQMQKNWHIKKAVSMIRKYHNHTLQTNPQHYRYSHRTITAKWQQQDNKSKATSSLLLVTAREKGYQYHMAAKFAVFVDEEHNKLPLLYWLPKLHTWPYKSRFIAYSSSCTTTKLSILLTSCLTEIKKHVMKYCTAVYEGNGKKIFWSIKYSGEILNELNS